MIFKHALASTLKNSINILLLWFMPILIIFIPAFVPNGLPYGFYMYGLLNLFVAFFMGKKIIIDRQNGTSLRIAASPVGYFRYLVEQLLAYFVIIMVQVVIFMIAMFIYWNNLNINWFLIFLVYMFYTLMTISLVLCWNAMFKTYVMSVSVFTSIASLIALLSGLTIEFEWLPEILQKTAIIFPTYWLTHGLTAIHTSNVLHIVLTYVILMVFTLIFILIGSRRRFN